MPIDVDHKRAGLMVPVFALRGREDDGIGDTQAVRETIDFCHRNGFGVLQLLPLNETGADNSPYNAISAFALDPTTISLRPGDVPGLTPDIRDRHLPEDIRASLSEGPVQYREIKPRTFACLAEAYANFEANELQRQTALAKEFFAFEREEADWLDAYCLFRHLLNEYEGSDVWPDWKEEHRSYEAAKAWLESLPDAEREDAVRSMEFFAYVQWVAYRQWRAAKAFADERRVELMGDIPFGVSRYSADVWSHQDLFDLDWCGGAPPEPLFDTDEFIKEWGQNWGIPLYDWAAHRAEDFTWWRRRTDALRACFHYFRIDHVLGFFRIYSFPWLPTHNGEFVGLSDEEAKEKTGGRLPQFMPGPDDPAESGARNEAQGRELLAVIQDAAEPTSLVAEDLGMVPLYVRPALREMGIPGFSIPIFERDWDGTGEFIPVEDYHAINLCTYATHDHFPLRTYYEDLVRRSREENGDEARSDLGKLMRFLGWDDAHPPAEFTRDLHDALNRAALRTPCWLTVFMITDVIGSTQRFNQPGTSSDDNWTQRLDHSMEELENDPATRERVNRINQLILETGRRPGD
ncbi:MAG: 4-alpha-glucanotransferase [Verrucomicrobiota bacterium]